MPKISVIVPVYNTGKHLSRCIDSILNQSFIDFELLLIDDGSTDGCGAICDAFAEKDKRIRVFHRENKGSAASRFFGFNMSAGTFIAAVDSDDWADSDYLERMMTTMENENADIVVCAYWINKNEDVLFVENKPCGNDALSWQRSFLGHKCHAGLWNKLLRKSILCGSTQVPEYDFYEDMVVSVSYLEQCQKLSYCPVASYHYCVNESSMTYQKDVVMRIRRLEEMLHNIHDLYMSLPEAKRIQLKPEFDVCVNGEKGKMIKDYPNQYGAYKRLFYEWFPKSNSIKYVKGITTLCRYLAIKGLWWPYSCIFGNANKRNHQLESR